MNKKLRRTKLILWSVVFVLEVLVVIFVNFWAAFLVVPVLYVGFVIVFFVQELRKEKRKQQST